MLKKLIILFITTISFTLFAKDLKVLMIGNSFSICVGKFFYSKNKGKKILEADAHHLNFKGEYLQACVWFGTLFDENPNEIKFKPEKLSAKETTILKEAAAKAVYQYKK